MMRAFDPNLGNNNRRDSFAQLPALGPSFAMPSAATLQAAISAAQKPSLASNQPPPISPKSEQRHNAAKQALSKIFGVK
jgi:hypothetical protein